MENCVCLVLELVPVLWGGEPANIWCGPGKRPFGDHFRVDLPGSLAQMVVFSHQTLRKDPINGCSDMFQKHTSMFASWLSKRKVSDKVLAKRGPKDTAAVVRCLFSCPPLDASSV